MFLIGKKFIMIEEMIECGMMRRYMFI